MNYFDEMTDKFFLGQEENISKRYKEIKEMLEAELEAAWSKLLDEVRPAGLLALPDTVTDILKASTYLPVKYYVLSKHISENS